MEWTNEIALEFLTWYENEPIIWCAKHPDHKNRNKIFDAWKRIQEKISVECTVEELKKKKECLMSTFRPLAKKVKATSGTGTGAEEVFKPAWFAYEKMANFLQGTCQPRSTQNTEELENLTADETLEDDLSENEENTDGNVAVIDEGRAGPSNNTTTKQFRAPVNTKTNLKRKHVDEVQGRMDEAYQILKTVVNKEKPKPSPCSLYGQLVAQKLEDLDEMERVLVMHDIDNLLFRATMKHFNNQTSNRGPANSSFQQCSNKAKQVPYYVSNNFSDQQSVYVSSPSEHSILPSPTSSWQSQPSPTISQFPPDQQQPYHPQVSPPEPYAPY